jgi:hypothetical protein
MAIFRSLFFFFWIFFLTPNNNKKKKKKKKPFFHLTKKKKKKKIFQNRFARFVTSNRVRKKLELLNSNLHNDASQLFMRLRTELRNNSTASPAANPRQGGAVRGPSVGPVAAPAAAPAASAAAAAARDATMSQYWANLDPEGRTVWESIFGDVPMVEWSQFIAAYRNALGGGNQPINESGLKYLLDNAGTNTVSLYKFSEFLRGFGPLQDSARKSAELVEAPWFHGYLSSHEAESLLHNARPFTFLVRISKSRLGSFALAYLNESKEPQHTLITSTAPHGFKIEEEVGTVAQHNLFATIAEVVQHYANILQFPFQSTLAREAWFHGDLTSQEAAEMLAGQPNGTFLFRFSSYPGHLAVSYNENGATQHGKVEMAQGGYLFKSKTDLQLYATLQQLVDDYKTLLSTPVLNTPWPSIEVGYHSGSAPRSPTPGGNGAVLASRQLPPPTRPGSAASHKGPNTTYVSMKGVGPAASAAASPARAMSPVRQPGPTYGVQASPMRSPGLDSRRVASPPLGVAQPPAPTVNVANSEYGQLTLGAMPSTGGGYGSLPSVTPSYGSVPTGPTSNYNSVPGGGVGDYGAIPTVQANALPNAKAYGAVPGSNGTQGAQYANRVASTGGTDVRNYGSVPVGTTDNGYGHLPVN